LVLANCKRNSARISPDIAWVVQPSDPGLYGGQAGLIPIVMGKMEKPRLKTVFRSSAQDDIFVVVENLGWTLKKWKALIWQSMKVSGAAFTNSMYMAGIPQLKA
jgi:hypothetical protein